MKAVTFNSPWIGHIIRNYLLKADKLEYKNLEVLDSYENFARTRCSYWIYWKMPINEFIVDDWKLVLHHT